MIFELKLLYSKNMVIREICDPYLLLTVYWLRVFSFDLELFAMPFLLHGSMLDLKTGVEFSLSRKVLSAKRKELMKLGH